MDPILEKNFIYLSCHAGIYPQTTWHIYRLKLFHKTMLFYMHKIRLLILRRLSLYIQHRIQHLTVKEKILKDDGRT